MRSRYTHLIGILGGTAAGKTCLLTSLYLMAANGQLQPTYRFAGSLTLRGFEERARRLRKWDRASLPEKLTDHTILADPRQPGLLHLALTRDGNGDRGRRLDLLLTDLPGEWTDELINRSSKTVQFEFLHRADGVIIVLDGRLLASKETRHAELHRSHILIERLVGSLHLDVRTPLILLVSKGDCLDMSPPEGVKQLADYASRNGFSARVVVATAFSSKPQEIANGSGVMEGIEAIICRPSEAPWLREPQRIPDLTRCFGRLLHRL